MQLTLQEDHELLQIIRQRSTGFEEAVSVLMERLGGFVVSMVCRCANLQHDDVEDVVQQIWIRVTRQESEEVFHTAAEFRGWLKSVARSKTVDFLRRRKEASIPEEFDAGTPMLREDPRIEYLQRCLDEMRVHKPQFATVVLAVTAGRPGDEISEELGISRNTVYTRFDRAKSELKDCMERRQS